MGDHSRINVACGVFRPGAGSRACGWGYCKRGSGYYRLLDVLGNQQDCWSACARRRDRGRKGRDDVARLGDPGAVHGDSAKNRFGVDRPIAAAGVLEAAAAVEENRRLTDDRQHGNTTGARLAKAGKQIEASPARGSHHHTQRAACSAITVGHRRSREFVLC